jgi:DNA-binding Xre family transcriptional regulator
MTEGEIVLNFGTNLNKIMHEFGGGLTVMQLVKRSGIAKRNIYRYLAFENLPTTRQLAKLCTALCCDAGELYGSVKQ